MREMVVVYESKYGVTRKYAYWLAEKLRCDIIEKSRCKVHILRDYETIIYGGGVYDTGIKGFSFIKKNYEELKDKNLIVFAVGASPKEDKKLLAQNEYKFFKDIGNIPCFYCKGAFDKNSITKCDKFLIETMENTLNIKEINKLDDIEKDFLYNIVETKEWPSKENLEPILDYVLKNIK